MVMNVTIDDTAGLLSYSSGWKIQPNSDPNFFQGTYHASQSSGSIVSVIFNGSAIYIYGSQGTGYGDFKVQLDDTVTFHSSALPASSSVSVKYQQVLYANIFSEGLHSVALSTTTDNWVDIDYVTLTIPGPDGGNSNLGSFPSTVSALQPSGTSSGAVILTSSQTYTSSSTSSPTIPVPSRAIAINRITATLTGVFGTLLALILISLIVYHLLKRYSRRQYEREQEFRRGAPYGRTTPGTPTPGSTPLGTEHRYGGRGMFARLLGGHGTSLSVGKESMMRFGSTASQSSLSLPPPPRPTHGHGISPLGTVPLSAHATKGAHQNSYPDPRQSIDFLSVR